MIYTSGEFNQIMDVGIIIDIDSPRYNDIKNYISDTDKVMEYLNPDITPEIGVGSPRIYKYRRYISFTDKNGVKQKIMLFVWTFDTITLKWEYFTNVKLKNVENFKNFMDKTPDFFYTDDIIY